MCENAFILKQLTPAVLSTNTLHTSIIPTYIDKLPRKGTTVLPNTIWLIFTTECSILKDKNTLIK